MTDAVSHRPRMRADGTPGQANAFIKLIKDPRHPAYVALAARAGTIFNSPEWLSLYGDRLRLYGIFADGDGSLRAACFFHESRFAGLKFITNPPYTPHNGWIFEHRSQNAAERLSETKRVIDAFADFFDRPSVAVVRFSFPLTVKDLQPFIWRKFKVVPNYTYRVDLGEPVAALEKRIAAKHRNVMRKATKSGVTVANVSDYRIVRDQVLKGVERRKDSVDRRLLDDLLSNFATPSNSYAFAAMYNGRPIAAALIVHDRSTAYYLLGGYDSSQMQAGAGTLCVWQSMLHAKAAGLATFDFEGSMLQDVERYFRGFGGDLVPYYTINKAWFPLELALKLIKREQF